MKPIGIFNDILPVLSDGEQAQLQLDKSGRLIVAAGAAGYAYVDPGTTAQPLGAAGAAGDRIAGLLLVPVNENVGYVTLKDGNGADLPVMAAGVLADLAPIWLPLGLVSADGGWKITTGGNVGAWVVGTFT